MIIQMHSRFLPRWSGGIATVKRALSQSDHIKLQADVYTGFAFKGV